MIVIKSLSVRNGDMFYIKHERIVSFIIDFYQEKDNIENAALLIQKTVDMISVKLLQKTTLDKM